MGEVVRLGVEAGNALVPAANLLHGVDFGLGGNLGLLILCRRRRCNVVRIRIHDDVLR